MKSDKEQIRQEIAEIRRELQTALSDLMKDVGKKLKPKEREELQEEFEAIDELFQRLESGLVWIAIFGKTNAGKSSIANSILGREEASVSVSLNHTIVASYFDKEPWKIVDVPGALGEPSKDGKVKVKNGDGSIVEISVGQLEEVAIKEAEKAHGHIFVITEQPTAPELQMFELVHAKTPQKPKIVMVNQWDRIEYGRTTGEQEVIQRQISELMGKFVDDKEKDIVYGSARLKVGDEMIRQDLPQLLDRLYENAGTLGQIMNLLDPANRAVDLSDKIKSKLIQTREAIARKVISAFGTASMAGGIIPFVQIMAAPAILVSMVFILSKIMGAPIPKDKAKAVASDLIKASWDIIAADLTLDIGGVILTAFLPFGIFAYFGAMAGSAYMAYRRTCILGEVTLEYIKHDFSWGGKQPQEVIKGCKQRALDSYMKLKIK